MSSKLTDKKSKLSPAKRALLEERLHGVSDSSQGDRRIQSRGHQNVAPPSFAQQRLWFLDQLAPGSFAYNIARAIRLRGDLDIVALQLTLNEISRRHQSLRTGFAVEDGAPVQVISPAAPVDLPVCDLSHLEQDEREVEVLRLTSKEAEQPFDLTRAPLMRVSLLRLGAEEHILLLTLHHIISDGWSTGVLFEELGQLYAAYSSGAPSPLAELPIQYADFAVWQRGWLQGEVLDRQLAYWKQQLGELPEMLQLPIARQRGTSRSARVAYHPLALSSLLSDAIRTFSRREGVTLFMTLLAAFKALLYRYTGQEDIVIGSAIANRNRAEIENLIGFFVNALALRTDLSGNPTFRQLLGRVREVTLAAYAHQDLPFEKLIQELRPDRALSQNPLFDLMFVLQNAPMQELELRGLTLNAMEPESGMARFNLEFQLWESPEGIRGLLIYNNDLFDAARVARMADHFQALLAGFVSAPDTRIAELSYLTDTEHQLLKQQTTPHDPQESSLYQLFEAQAERTPEAVALVFEDEQLTYDELNRRSNQLARYLRGCGVGAETVVGICMERSAEMVVGLLGILKAGGAYLPLDPAYPRERLLFMLEDTRASVLLTHYRLLETLPTHTTQVVCLDRDWGQISGESNAHLESASESENLAYVIYTSGSTGEPKGVLITHANVTRLFSATQAWFHFSAQDVWTLFHSYAFDFSVWELWGALLHGGRLVIVPYFVSRATEAFYQLLCKEGVTVLNQTPSAFRQLSAVEEAGVFNELALRLIIFGGEALELQSLRSWFERHGDEQPQLVNMYGITETTVHVTYRPLGLRDLSKASGSVIGGRIPDLRVYVLDPQMQMVPIDVPGEMYVGGAGLARGYLNRAELTAERFVPDPFSPEPGARLYRSGDLARYLDDGDIEYLGRIDHQVKIRGFRIELGEIETALGRHPAVREAVVAVQDDGTEEKRLVAYVVCDADGQVPQEQVLEIRAEHVSQWQMLYDEKYNETPREPEDPTFNIIGWDSSYTGEPIPAVEMHEWLDHTVERILAERPQRVLEIGCGTGLLLLRMAPYCARYWGTDFSQVSLDFIRRQLTNHSELSHVKLLQRMADNFENIAAGAFDAVVINSVIQYFPDHNYLLRVLKGAVKTVAPGGFIFLGDVRNLRLLEALHTSVQLYQAPPTLSTDELLRRVEKQMEQEEELLIDPTLFLALKEQMPEISSVKVLLKRGRHHNELNTFRYDVIVAVGRDAGVAEVLNIDWPEEQLTLPDLRHLLRERAPATLCLRRVPNARVLADLRAVELLRDEKPTKAVGELQKVLVADNAVGVDPEDIWRLSETLPYTAEVHWSDADGGRSYTVMLQRRSEQEQATVLMAVPELPVVSLQFRPLAAYVNNPLKRALSQKLVPQLRSYLNEKLPEYMMPSAFVMLDTLPLTPNGKLDRRALPVLRQERPELAAGYIPPGTPQEELLASIWAEVLRVERIGLHDNFFELGGHSLLATQVMSRIRETFNVNLPLRYFFDRPTVAGLAEFLRDAKREDKKLMPEIKRLPRSEVSPLPEMER